IFTPTKLMYLSNDFGTGYSSLSYLHYLPIDTLKIDRCFVNNQDDPKNRDIIRAIINLAHDLELEVVAEGIETQQQLVWLQELGCDYGQGYLFARPLDSDSAKNLIASAWSFDCTENNFPLNP
ncbi:MAG: EAL domain-containing protein, partial [Cyanobacteria bacterium J083]